MAFSVTVLGAACSGGGTTDAATGPATVASVQLSVTAASISVGSTTVLTAVALDAAGNSIAGQSAAWQSSSAAVASVAAGVVTGVAAGSAVITATIGAKSSQATVTVTAAVVAACAGAAPLVLNVGDVHILTAAERGSFCVSGQAAGSEYVLIPFKADTASASVSVSLQASGVTAASGAPTAAAAARLGSSTAVTARISGSAAQRPLGAQRSAPLVNEFADAFEHRLRSVERTQLTPIVTAGTRGSLLRSMLHASSARSAILNLAATPALGTLVQLNANGNDACTNPEEHTARVAAVSKAAIIAVDTLAPAGGFTDADYAAFATTFDTLIYPVDTAAFGAPADLDANGRVLIFFTQAVNQLTPPGAAGYVGGFFFARDLFPDTAQSALLQACAASNQGEMFYVPVVDVNQSYNEFFTDKSALRIELIGTLAHELQHLINASRRLYVTQTANWSEDVWLNEGMSHLAEELLYFRVSGFAPKQSLTLAAVTGSQAVLDAINDYQVQNLARLQLYLQSPSAYSAFAENDSLPTRGATYQLLRYALDQSVNTNSSYLRALVNSTTTGVANFNTVFAATFPNIYTAVQQQVLANFFGGSGIPVAQKYAFPSWNYRDVIGNGLNGGLNPLTMTALASGSATTFTLGAGGAGYARFRVAASGTATITAASGAGTVPANVVLILARAQ